MAGKVREIILVPVSGLWPPWEEGQSGVKPPASTAVSSHGQPENDGAGSTDHFQPWVCLLFLCSLPVYTHAESKCQASWHCVFYGGFFICGTQGLGPQALIARDKFWPQSVASQLQIASWRLPPSSTFCKNQSFHHCNSM